MDKNMEKRLKLEMQKNPAIGGDFLVDVEQELVDKPIMNASELMSNLYIAFSSQSHNMRKATGTGMQIIQLGKSIFKNAITQKQEDRIQEILTEVRELRKIPINRRTKTYLPEEKFSLVCEAVGIITRIADVEGLIIREKQVRENTVLTVDGGLEGFAPASRNITHQSDEVFEDFET